MINAVPFCSQLFFSFCPPRIQVLTCFFVRLAAPLSHSSVRANLDAFGALFSTPLDKMPPFFFSDET